MMIYLFHAGLIFQHGNCAEHFQLARELAQRAIEQGDHSLKSLYAAIDRYLVSVGNPNALAHNIYV